MKRQIWITVGIVCGIIVISVLINQIVAQSAPKNIVKTKPIPERIMKIAERSCVKCHTEPGSPMALAHLDLYNWDKYSAEKQAAKAKKMCSMVTKAKMPPKSFRAKNPGDIPSLEEVNMICNWASEIQPKN